MLLSVEGEGAVVLCRESLYLGFKRPLLRRQRVRSQNAERSESHHVQSCTIDVVYGYERPEDVGKWCALVTNEWLSSAHLRPVDRTKGVGMRALIPPLTRSALRRDDD